MTINPTDRGTTFATPTTATSLSIASGAFTPAAGSVLIALVGNRTATGPFPPTMSDTFGDTGGTAWAMQVNRQDSVQPQSESIWSRTVGTGPASGAITAATQDIGTSCARNIILSILETTGLTSGTAAQTASNIGTTSSLTDTFAGAPAATSLVVSNVDGNNGSACTLPAGFTALNNSSYGGDCSAAAYRNGGAGTTVDWTGMTSANPATSVAAEFTAAVVVPSQPLIRQARMGSN